ncbi:MAG: S41 family peptidase [Acholeplasmataceae bacterium]
METKKLGILFLFSVILAFFAGYFSSNLVESKMVIESDEIFDYITKAFDEYYYYEIDSDDVYDAFIKSMNAVVDSYAENNNDPYTKINAVASNITSSKVESFVGMGIDFYFDGLNLRVIDVNDSSSLYLNLFPYDLITGVVEDEEIIYFDDLESTDDVLTYLQGQLDETQVIIVENVYGEIYQLSFTYNEIDTPSTYTLDLGYDDIGYIKIDSFNGYSEGVTVGTNYVFNTLLRQLETTTLLDENSTLILDLRDNPGGSLTALNNKGTNLNPGITQLLLPYSLTHSIFNLVDKNDDVIEYYGGLSTEKTYDIKVLVNENSASASEVLAASMYSYGYTLYGHQTYGKGVYQNSIYLNDIRNVSYYLTYTEGIWNYDDDKNVMTEPLPVTEIVQSGILTLDLPVFMYTLSYDMVDSTLVDYQKFLNVYFENNYDLRTDGYYDIITENLVKLYQLEKGITQTGTINLETAQHIYADFKVMSNDANNDAQLQALLAMINEDDE